MSNKVTSSSLGSGPESTPVFSLASIVTEVLTVSHPFHRNNDMDDDRAASRVSLDHPAGSGWAANKEWLLSVIKDVLELHEDAEKELPSQK